MFVSCRNRYVIARKREIRNSSALQSLSPVFKSLRIQPLSTSTSMKCRFKAIAFANNDDNNNKWLIHIHRMAHCTDCNVLINGPLNNTLEVIATTTLKIRHYYLAIKKHDNRKLNFSLFIKSIEMSQR